MTSDKARKAAIRQRMARTGEPYNAARRATETDAGSTTSLRDAATLARERADRAEEGALELEERAAMARTDVRLAQDPAERQRAQELFDRLSEAAEQARQRADRADFDAFLAEERVGDEYWDDDEAGPPREGSRPVTPW